MKIIFFGTPQFSAQILSTLIQDKESEVVAVVTQADKPVGRGNAITSPPVKKIAERSNIPVIQPNNSSELKMEIEKFENIDFFVVVAFGIILNKELLQMPKYCALNIHTSILPKYRGASPIQEALLHGDHETGISFMKMDEEMDHGPIYKIIKVQISEEDTLQTLSEKLSETAVNTLISTLDKISSQILTPKDQDHTKATYCKKIKKSDGFVNFNQSAVDIVNMIKAYNQWPSVYFEIGDKNIKITKAKISDENIKEGEFKIDGKILKIGTKKGTLMPEILQPEGKKETSVENFLNGYKTLIQSINQKSA